MRPRVAIVTSYPREHVVEVYNEMARQGGVDFRVFYLRKLPHGRHWEYGRSIEHDHVFLPELRLRPHLYLSPGFAREHRAYRPSLSVVTQYSVPAMQALMVTAGIRRHPWVFWAERPGVKFAEAPIVSGDWARTVGRTVALQPVKLWAREIWGIGSRACAEYRSIAPRTPIRNLPYYSDLGRFVAAARSRTASENVRCLFSGALTVRKGADLVASAMRELLAGGMPVELDVLGAGPFDADLRALASEWPRRVRVHGFQQLDDVAAHYGSADVLLFPSRHDGWGMALLEGMAAGLLPIATREAGAAHDAVENGASGIILDALTPTALTSAIRRLVQLGAERGLMARRAQASALRFGHEDGAAHFGRELLRAVAEHC